MHTRHLQLTHSRRCVCWATARGTQACTHAICNPRVCADVCAGQPPEAPKLRHAHMPAQASGTHSDTDTCHMPCLTCTAHMNRVSSHAKA
eukprot:scaffold296434_cov18-Tisochrysis_lutea.AAC.1